jgi:signal peptidase I
MLLLLVRQFVVQPFSIPTGAMQPTLMGNRRLPDGRTLPGDHLLVEKVSFRFRAPARGDIVMFKTRGINHYAVPCRRQFKTGKDVGAKADELLEQNRTGNQRR